MSGHEPEAMVVPARYVVVRSGINLMRSLQHCQGRFTARSRVSKSWF